MKKRTAIVVVILTTLICLFCAQQLGRETQHLETTDSQATTLARF